MNPTSNHARVLDAELLEPQVARWMIERHRHATLIAVPGCGHAPALDTAQHSAWVEDFLAGR
jgi:pimeloyl-ACP methyl ester carboxylesterase